LLLIDDFLFDISITFIFAVAFGEFYGQSPSEDWNMSGLSETIDPLDKPEERLRLLHEPLGEGPTIIYVPTRKETLRITKYLCGFGVKAAAYNASVFIDNY
jgi:Werner syndrome ATP-dependent helicase